MTNKTTRVDGNTRWWVLGVLALTQLVIVLDATIMNIALPEAQKALGFDDNGRQWIVTAYSLTFGGLLLVGGRVSDLFGRKRSLIVGLVGFAAASALGGWAQSFEVLVAARAMQGVFGALLAPAALSLLTVTFADSKDRARAFGIYGAISGAGGAVGLLLGGVLTEYLSWNWCLYVNVIIIAIAVVGAVKLLPATEESAGDKPRLDIVGAILVTTGLFSLVYGLANSETNGWTDTWTLTFIGAGAALLAAFVLAQTKVAHPLLPMRVLLDRYRGTSYLVMVISAIGMFGVFLYLTYYLQSLLEYSPVAAGVAFLPMVAALAITASTIGKITSRVTPKITVGVGLVVGAAGMAFLTGIELNSSYVADILPGLLLLGVGLGAVFSTAMGLATLGVRTEDAGVASATVNTAQQIGGSIGVSLLSSFAATAAANYYTDNGASGLDAEALARNAELASYHTAFWWASGFFLAGAVVAALLYPAKVAVPDPDAVPVLAH